MRLRVLVWALVAAWHCFIGVARAGQPDLQLTLAHSPQPVSQGELLTAALVVTNAGNGAATGVSLVVTLSSNATFFSTALSQGTFSQGGGTVTCDLGSLSAQSVATVSVVVTPEAVGLLTNSAAVTEAELDANPADNLVSRTSLVVPFTFYAGPVLNIGRSHHTATTLPDGRILFTGGTGSSGFLASAELYDPQTKAFTLTGNMTAARTDHAATLLLDGTVLITGGLGAPVGLLNSAEIYNPTNGTFNAISNMLSRHGQHTATRLGDGRVLIAGNAFSNGSVDQQPDTAELYVPALHGFTNTGRMTTGGGGQRAVLLTNGKVALLNGIYYGQYPAISDLYDPAAGTFSSLGYPQFPRYFGGAAQLLDGRILLAGGSWYTGPPYSTSSEIFNPGTLTFSNNAAMRSAHPYANATRLLDGKVLVTGADPAPELFDPAANTFSHVAGMAQARTFHTASLLSDGTVLIVGGLADTNLASTEIYDPARTKSPPLVSIRDASAPEGNAGSNTMVFNVIMSTAMGWPVSVDYATAPGSAESDLDFLPTSGRLTFPPGVTNQTVSVMILGDVDYEPDETFSVNLSNPTNAIFNYEQGIGTILNDDAMPVLTMASASEYESNRGTTNLVFNLSLSARSYETVSVNYATTDDTALAGSDYGATNGTVVFVPGTTNQAMGVIANGDLQVEPDETFFVQLSGATNATLGNISATGTILDDDGAPGWLHHFEIVLAPGRQFATGPLVLTVWARDAANNPATNFSGHVLLSVGTVDEAPQHYGFEDGQLGDWSPLNGPTQPGPYEIKSFDVNGDGDLSMAFRTAAGRGVDGIARQVPLLGGRRYYVSGDFAESNEGGAPNGGDTVAYLSLGGVTLANSHFGGVNNGDVLRSNLNATFDAPQSGGYTLSLTFNRDPWFELYSLGALADDVVLSAAPIAPRWTAHFTNGVWTGTNVIPIVGSNYVLYVEDEEGHRGSGNAFDVEPAANLALQVTNTPALARAGSDITFTLWLTNRGPFAALNVAVTNILVGDVTIRSATNNFGTAAIFRQHGRLQYRHPDQRTPRHAHGHGQAACDGLVHQHRQRDRGHV